MDAFAIQGSGATPTGAAPATATAVATATESKEATNYSVEYEKGIRLDAKTWESVEKGQQTEHNRAVNAALLEHLHQLDGHGAAERNAPSYATLNDSLYATLVAHTELKTRAAAPADPSPLDAKKGKGGKPTKKVPVISKKDQIRTAASEKKINEAGKEIALAMKQGGGPLKRFLGSQIYEVRGAALMWYAHQLAAAGTAAAANELDVAIQKFLVSGRGRSYTDPASLADPSPAMVADLKSHLLRLRGRHPFDGVQLAVDCPSVIWRTRYDACLPEAPIRARQNQRESIEVLREYAKDGKTFVVLNRAPPGAGKSALLVPIAALLTRPGAPPDEELYVCAGQGRTGVIQFMQALYGASIPFAAVFVEQGDLQIVKQHSNRGAVCRVFVGTADAVHRLMQSPKRHGWLVIDEPTYGADVAGSAACRDIMTLLAGLAPENRRVVMLGATLPRVDEMPAIIGHFGRAHEVSGSHDSIQIACEVRTTGGRAVLPHSGCATAADVQGVISQVASKPFLARMYTVSTLVLMCDALRGAGATGAPPDLRASFDSAQNLKPEVVTMAALRTLEFLATQSDLVVTAVARAAPPDVPPVAYGELGTRGAYANQAMVVDTDPLGFALEHFDPLLAAMRKERVPTADALYAAYGKVTGAAAKAAAAAESRKKKGLADGKSDGGKDQEDPYAADMATASARLGFPDWAQIGTPLHQARFGSPLAGGDESRQCASAAGIPHCAVADDVQLLLLAGVGILSSRAVPCAVYQSEVWRRASLGQLAYVVTDHSGCYGANMLLGTVLITERFAAAASLATIEQAGGRLCRVGLTYKGTLVLPEAAAASLLASVRLGAAAPVCTEAANMEAAFRAALDL